MTDYHSSAPGCSATAQQRAINIFPASVVLQCPLNEKVRKTTAPPQGISTIWERLENLDRYQAHALNHNGNSLKGNREQNSEREKQEGKRTSSPGEIYERKRRLARKKCKGLPRSHGHPGIECNQHSHCEKEIRAMRQWETAPRFVGRHHKEPGENEIYLEAASQSFPFINLPQEIRDMIFGFGLVKKGNKKPALLRAVRVNKILYASALPIYYRNNMHFFSILHNSPIDILDTKILNLLRQVTFYIPDILACSSMAKGVTAAENITHLTLLADSPTGVNIFAIQHIHKFKKLKCVIVEVRTWDFFELSKEKLKSRLNFVLTLNQVLGMDAIVEGIGLGKTWTWRAIGDAFMTKELRRHLKFDDGAKIPFI